MHETTEVTEANLDLHPQHVYKEIRYEVNAALKSYCLVVSRNLKIHARKRYVNEKTADMIELRNLAERTDLLARHCSRYIDDGEPSP